MKVYFNQAWQCQCRLNTLEGISCKSHRRMWWWLRTDHTQPVSCRNSAQTNGKAVQGSRTQVADVLQSIKAQRPVAESNGLTWLVWVQGLFDYLRLRPTTVRSRCTPKLDPPNCSALNDTLGVFPHQQSSSSHSCWQCRTTQDEFCQRIHLHNRGIEITLIIMVDVELGTIISNITVPFFLFDYDIENLFKLSANHNF